ncbi:MAG: hypothetical protein RLZZ444_1235, partial [Pseudomonadota bacterium]
ASLDYGGTWKAMHYQARRFFAPETIVAIPSGDRGEIALSMINDGADTAGFKVEVVTVDLDGRSHPLMQLEGQCPTDRAAEIGRIDASSVPDGHLLVWSWTVTNGGAGRGHHVMSTYKVLDLKPSGLALHEAKSEDGQRLLTLSATGLALFVMVEADCPGRFSDNAFDLFAGESRTISFMPDDPDAAPRFTLRDLHSCQATE